MIRDTMTITRKLLLINSLIFAAFMLMILVVFFSFRHIEHVLTTGFASETHRIIENSNMTRGLSRALSDMDLILRTFYGKKEIWKSEGIRLFDGIQALLVKSGDKEMKDSLNRLKQHLTDTLAQCELVNSVRENIREIEIAFGHQIIALDDIIVQRLVKRMIAGEDTSDLEQLSSMIGGWRESFIRMKLQFVQLGLEHFKHPMNEQAHPLISQTEDLQLRLRTLTAAAPDIAENGRNLIGLLTDYKVAVLKIHRMVENLGSLLEENNLEKEKLLSMMERIDLDVAKKTEGATRALTGRIHQSMLINFIIFISILPIVLLGGITAFSIKAPLVKVIEYIRRLSKGDIPEPIEDEYKGVFALVRDYLNMLIRATNSVTQVAENIAAGNMETIVQERSNVDRLIQALNRMSQRLGQIIYETKGMIQSVGQGQMDIRGNAEAFEGGWREMISGVNDLIDGLSTAISRSAALSQEMELARNIQTCLLPPPISLAQIHPEFDISAIMVPADQVGGDFYEITSDQFGNLRLAIGDVSGHGVTPGLIMMMAQTVHATVISNHGSNARDTVIKINEILYANVHERLKETHFMTFNALKYLGKGRFEHAGAHLRIIVFRRESGQFELIRTEGIYLNFKKDISRSIKNAYFELGEDDIMILYTDGLTEARNSDGELLDIKGFIDILKRHTGHDPNPEIMTLNILTDVLNWCDNIREDDMSLVIVKRKRAGMIEEKSVLPVDGVLTKNNSAAGNVLFLGDFIDPNRPFQSSLSTSLKLPTRSIDQKKLWASKDYSAEFLGKVWSLFVDSEKTEHIRTVLHSVCVELIENAITYGHPDEDYSIAIEPCTPSRELLVHVVNKCAVSRIPDLEISARLLLNTSDIRKLFTKKMEEAKSAKKHGKNRSQLGFVRIAMQDVRLAWKIKLDSDIAIVTTLARIPLPQ